MGFYAVRPFLLVSHGRAFVCPHFPIPFRYTELFTRKQRETTIDHKARMEAIVSLKSMLKSWLDTHYPRLTEEDRARRAMMMDMHLVEKRKAEDMQTVFEINNLVWTSMLEMQFMKKVSCVLLLV